MDLNELGKCLIGVVNGCRVRLSLHGLIESLQLWVGSSKGFLGLVRFKFNAALDNELPGYQERQEGKIGETDLVT